MNSNPNSDSDSDSHTFNSDSLRLIVGALAFGFPIIVIALIGRIPMSISAAYYEDHARDVFVGILFIIGALLVAYKGHQLDPTAEDMQREQDHKPPRLLSRLRIHQEELISTVGGIAAIITALFPTAEHPPLMDGNAYVHVGCAFFLFGTIAYFCLVAFPRSLNRKLVKTEPSFMTLIESSGSSDLPAPRGVFAQIVIFLRIANQAGMEYQGKDGVPDGRLSPDAPKPGKVLYMWMAYGKKLTRGYVYLICGPAILLTLAVFLVMLVVAWEFVNHSNTTFVIETIALGFFGVAWVTAAKLRIPYLPLFENWLAMRSRKIAKTQLAT